MKNPGIYFLIAVSILLSTTVLQAKRQIVINSANLKCNDTVLVFTPKGWTPQAGTTPALFLLHGWSGDWSNWDKRTDIQAISDKYEIGRAHV